MSFSKSAVKRFNDITSCAPAPGTYNVKVVQKSTRPVVFEKSDRFKACKESVGSCHSELDTSTCSSYLSTPSKKLFASPFQRAPNSLRSLNKKISASCENIVSKKHANLAAELEDRDQKIAELQLRVKCAENELLVLQCNIDRLTGSNSKLEADKTESLMCCEKMKQEITELEGLTDKLKEENENLQQKLSTREESLAIDVCSHGNIIDELETKKQQIIELEMTLDYRVKTLEADLEQSEANIAALKETNEALVQNKNDALAHSDEVEHEVIQLQALADKLRLEKLNLEQKLVDQEQNNLCLHNEVLALQLTTDEKITQIRETLEDKLKRAMLQEEEMKREIEDSQQKLKESVNINTQLSQDRASLEEKVNNLQVRMSQLISDTDIKDSLIMGLEKQTENHKEEIKLERQKSLKYEEDSTLLKEQLEICEHTMTNNLKSLSEKYQSMEETLATVENDYRKKIDLLNSELHSNQKTSFQLTNECETLRRNNINLLDQLNYEKDKKDYLQSDLSKFKEESNRIEASLKEQLKQALGSLQSSHKKREVQQQSIGDLESTCADQSLQILHLQNELKLKQSKVDELLSVSEDLSRRVSQEEMASLKLLRVTSEYERFKQSSCQTTDELQRQMHEMKVNEARYKQIEEQLKRQLEETEEKNKRSKEEFGRRLIETQKKLTLKENDMEKLRESAETKMKVALEELSRQQKEFQDQITVLEEQASSVNESALEELQEDVTKWKTLFENLQEKVKPFQVQLDAFAAEKNLLLSQNCQAKTEVQQLSTQYAKLLGHQNNKQKIQHVLKLKEENLSLKEEVMKLREQTTKQQRQLGELGYKQDSRKKFNPAMAFKHSKENSTPLGDQNTV